MEGAARFGLSHGFVIMDVDCGECEGKRHAPGAGWESMGISPASRDTGHSVKNSTQAMGKVFSSQWVPLLLCRFVCSSLQAATFMLMQLWQRWNITKVNANCILWAGYLNFEKAVAVYWCIWFLDRAFLGFKASISPVGETVFLPKIHFNILY